MPLSGLKFLPNMANIAPKCQTFAGSGHGDLEQCYNLLNAFRSFHYMLLPSATDEIHS